MSLACSSHSFREIIVGPLYQREKARERRIFRCACRLAAFSENVWSPDQLATIRAAENDERALDAILSDKQLRPILHGNYYDQARIEQWEAESRGLGCSPLTKTSWLVMCEVFIGAIRQLVPDSEHFSDDYAYQFQGYLRETCEWLLTGEGTPDSFREKELTTLENNVAVRDELLRRLFTECPEEYRAMGLPEPPGGKKGDDGPALPILSDAAAGVYEILIAQPFYQGMTGPQLLDALLARGINIEQSTLTSRIIPELEPYGVENAPRKGYRIPENRRPKK